MRADMIVLYKSVSVFKIQKAYVKYFRGIDLNILVYHVIVGPLACARAAVDHKNLNLIYIVYLVLFQNTLFWNKTRLLLIEIYRTFELLIGNYLF